MSRKQNSSSSSLLLAAVLVISSGGFLGAIFTVWKVSLIGSILVFVAFVETIAILAGYIMFQRGGKMSKT